MTTLYGISNCDNIKKAKDWLESNGVDYSFHDYKNEGIDAATLKLWCNEFGFEALLNRRGTTWRKLDESVKNNINESKAIGIMQDNASIIKRPVLISGKIKILGFNEAEYKTLL
jgi:arsenate reductase (glutaredoxin)